MSVIGILVCYYPEYKNKSSAIFKKLLNNISVHNKLIIVNNNNLQPSFDSDVEYSGDNSGWEFGSWDLGLEYVKDNLCNEDIVILANDTFCFNRKFTFFDSWLFSQAFKKINNKCVLVGEKCQLKESFDIDGYSINSWISTYLYGASYSTLLEIMPFNNDFFKEQNIIDFSKKRIEIPNFSHNLNEHLSQWLFPSKEQHGWYKAKNGNVNERLWLDKLHAIYNEKMLSAKVIKNGGQLYDVYGNNVFKYISKIFRKIKFI